MDRNRLYEDGFKDQEEQIRTLYRQGKSKKQISEKLNISEDRIVQALQSDSDMDNLNE